MTAQNDTYIVKTASRLFLLSAKDSPAAIRSVVNGTTWKCPWTGKKIAKEPPAAVEAIRPLGTMIPQ